MYGTHQVLSMPGFGQDVRKMLPVTVEQLSITIPALPAPSIHSRPPSEPSSPARRLVGDRLPPVPKPTRIADPFGLHGNTKSILLVIIQYLNSYLCFAITITFNASLSLCI